MSSLPQNPSTSVQALFDEASRQLAQGQQHRAEMLFREVLARDPGHADALHMLGHLAYIHGHNQAAADLVRMAIARSPRNAGYYNTLGQALVDLGKLDEAINTYKIALQLMPKFAEAMNNLGVAYKYQGRTDDAAEIYKDAIRVQPNAGYSHNNLANIWRDAGYFQLAIDSYRRAIELIPTDGRLHSNLAGVLKDAGLVEESIPIYDRALEVEPISIFVTAVRSNRLYAMHYLPDENPPFMFEQAKRWATIHADPVAGEIQPHTNDRNPDRRLRVGYVSPNFADHSVSAFFESLLVSHDRNLIEPILYSDLAQPDAITQRLQRLAAKWVNITGLLDKQVAEMIRSDRIDILVDLAGHTGNNRMMIFARKPAPIQITWLGYPDTTGLSTMEYRFTDAYADPPDQTDPFHTEELIRLPETFLCYFGPFGSPAAPAISPPVQSAGHITFGSFNATPKVNARIIGLWSKILHAVPNSRIILKSRGLADPAGAEHVKRIFTQNDIPLDRVTLLGRIPARTEHLQIYDQVDLALDTFPYHGTTTTCEAFWMGVPVVTLAGQTHMSRVGASLLTNVGLPDLIAHSPDDYVRIATELAADVPRLRDLRRTLRQRMQSGPLMDAPRFARNVEAAYRQVWRKWVNGATG